MAEVDGSAFTARVLNCFGEFGIAHRRGGLHFACRTSAPRCQSRPDRERAYVIVDGTMDVERSGKCVAQLEPGDFVGEIALPQNTVRTATVRTSSAVRMLVVTGRDFWTLLDSAPALQRKLLAPVAERSASDSF